MGEIIRDTAKKDFKIVLIYTAEFVTIICLGSILYFTFF